MDLCLTLQGQNPKTGPGQKPLKLQSQTYESMAKHLTVTADPFLSILPLYQLGFRGTDRGSSAGCDIGGGQRREVASAPLARVLKLPIQILLCKRIVGAPASEDNIMRTPKGTPACLGCMNPNHHCSTGRVLTIDSKRQLLACNTILELA